MANTYYLMRKNDIVTMAVIEEDGHMRSVSEQVNVELAPFQYRYRPDWIKAWWADRAVPLSQGRISEILKAQGCLLPSEYLVKNLGLSLTDHYWVKPTESSLTWEQVNLFDNDFKSNLTFSGEDEKNDDVPHYSPNSSLQGDIEKTWSIINGRRCLVKGNRDYLSCESINEVIASHLHKLQGYDNYTDYKLIKIKDSDYNFGCYCEVFTSQSDEFIPAYALYSSRKKRNDMSHFQHYMNVCKALGTDMDQLQRDMDYQMITDFLLSGYDRHLNNFGVIRDAETLEIKRMAPIFDSGGCLFAGREVPVNIDMLLDIKTNGFAEKEVNVLKYVKDRQVVDLDKLPPASYIREMYEKDDKMDKKRTGRIVRAYEMKTDICRKWQKGKLEFR